MSEPELLVHSKSPFNAETTAKQLASFITPRTAFYIRSHGDIPTPDAATYRLIIDGNVARPLELSLQQLRGDFAQHDVTVTLQCAGNRRADLDEIKPVTGDLWRIGAIGNAIWRGVRLGDVLAAAGAATGEHLHVAFAALDAVTVEEEHFHFGVSIPMTKARSPEVLLALQMNGAALPAAHGFPLRVIVPGYAGVRSPKWLARVTVQSQPSDNHMQQRDYKLLPPHITKETVDWAAGITIDEMPLNSAITSPEPGAKLRAGANRITGYATVSGRAVARVELSADDGESWTQATLADEASPWSWWLWHADLNLPLGEYDLLVRAWDSAGQTQPSAHKQTWNFKGYLSAAWHRVAVTVA